MKKVFLLFIGLTMSGLAMAQNTTVTTKLPQNHNTEFGNDATNNGFGVKGGVNFNQLRGDDKSNLTGFNNETSWHAGVYGQFSVRQSQFFSVQAELLFNRRAFTVADTLHKMDYFEVPFLFVFNVLDNVSLHIGPQVGVLMTVKEDDKEVGEATKKKMNSFVYGIDAGAEARIKFARLGARYYLGLNDIYKNPETLGTKAVSDLKAGMFQVYVGFGI